MQKKRLLDGNKFDLTIERLCHELLENHGDFSNSAIIGIQPRGTLLSDRIVSVLNELNPELSITYGKLDITFYRDDFRRKALPLNPSETEIEFSVEGKKIILIDDVLYTGRTVRAAMDAVLDFGRPAEVELLVLIDRRFSREFPIQSNYTGKTVDAIDSQKVVVNWAEYGGEDRVTLVNEKKLKK
ncbi:MAG: bifunctional pyr operon transcriptional regulator/uracil phosphoribosyltransferase PyrR [Chitinophagaceae bacterium]|nr:MAG: bifunctional pyr operon transcriptional regulator/uracil phosphoribosyltransferase PyrR [Chitinophagaceae bacterium]